jgi:hypothetical protein
MPKLSERIAKSGVNMLVIIIAIVVFVVAFVIMMGISNASRPNTIDILAASRDLNFGDPITSADLVTITVYKDKLADKYIPADQANQVVGGYAALPIYAGQPVTRDAIMATAGIATRLSAILSQYPGYSLFPLPLDAANVVAADTASYVPGDLVSVTIVIASRPQPPVTPTPIYSGSYSYVITPTPVPTVQSGETTVDDALSRVYPPMAKNLFPQGVRVVAIQGLPAETVSQDTTSSSSTSGSSISSVDYNLPKRLVLLVPSKSVEMLALGLQSGDMVIVSMVTEGQADTTTGFSYWDFEELFRLERETILK